MNYTVDELVNRLAKGESVDTIAAEMSNMLNAATKQHEEAQRVEEAKRKADQSKRDDMADILTRAAHWIKTYYPSLSDDLTKELDDKDKAELFDILLDATIEGFDKATKSTFNANTNLFMDPFAMFMMADLMKNKATNSKSDDDVLKDFLDTLFLTDKKHKPSNPIS